MMTEAAQFLEYDPLTGVFRWRVPPHPRIKPGTVAGHVTTAGYVTIMFRKRHHLAHRLAWFMVHGEVPHQIDHKDGDKANNRIGNLRPTNDTLNHRNRVEHRAGKLPGVSPRDGKWRAKIWRSGKCVSLGTFATAEAASAAFEAASRT